MIYRPPVMLLHWTPQVLGVHKTLVFTLRRSKTYVVCCIIIMVTKKQFHTEGWYQAQVRGTNWVEDLDLPQCIFHTQSIFQD